MHPVLLHIGSILIPAYGALAALGVLLGLALALRTARMVEVNPNHVWNLSILALFSALAGSRLLLVIANRSALREHPAWILSFGMIHHPLVAAAGSIFGLVAAAIYARRHSMPMAATADALAPPLALGLAIEQAGALLAGAGYGTETTVRWAVIYTHPLAAIWSGAPLGIPVHPVQAYAALAYLTIAGVLLIQLPRRRQAGDIAGLFLMTAGTAAFLTEFFRDPEGRGVLLGGAVDGPQIGAILLVIAGALVLLERKTLRERTSLRERKPAIENAGPAPNNTEQLENETSHD